MSTISSTTIQLSGVSGTTSANYDLETAVLSLTLDRIGLFDTQISDWMGKMKDKNAKATKYNAAMQVLNKIKNTFNADAKSSAKVNDEGKKCKADLEATFKEAGLKFEGDKKFDNLTKGDIEATINKVQGLVDENNNTSQMDQLQLQSLISKRNTMFEMASNILKKIIDSLSAITSNMR